MNNVLQLHFLRVIGDKVCYGIQHDKKLIQGQCCHEI